MTRLKCLIFTYTTLTSLFQSNTQNVDIVALCDDAAAAVDDTASSSPTAFPVSALIMAMKKFQIYFSSSVERN